MRNKVVDQRIPGQHPNTAAVQLAPVRPAHDLRKISRNRRTTGATRSKMSSFQKWSHCLVVGFNSCMWLLQDMDCFLQ